MPGASHRQVSPNELTAGDGGWGEVREGLGPRGTRQPSALLSFSVSTPKPFCPPASGSDMRWADAVRLHSEGKKGTGGPRRPCV